MVVTRRSRVRLADMPADVISAIVAAASPDEAATAAALSATCRPLRRVVLESCIAAAHMRQFACSQQIAPVLQRLAGLQRLSLAHCAWDAIPWPELEQLQQLRNLTLPLASRVTSMQPITALQQLTALTFTECEHGAGKQPPTTALAALTRLVALDASGCEPFEAAGLQHLSALQRLEVLDVPWDEPQAVARLAAQLPRLRTLCLQCCSAAGLAAKLDGELRLCAATALTQLRLRVSADDASSVQQLQLPPKLQALELTIVMSSDDATDGALAILNALPLQHLVSLSLLDARGRGHSPTVGLLPLTRPEIRIQAPAQSPRLQKLHFGSHRAWDALHEALWPLVLVAARSAPEHAAKCGASAGAAAALPHSNSTCSGGAWRLCVTVDKVVKYSLTAADILQKPALNSAEIIDGMDGHLEAICFDESSPLELLRGVEDELNPYGHPVLCSSLSSEKRLTRVELADLPPSDVREDDPELQELGCHAMAALRHLNVTRLAGLSIDDCRHVGILTQLTTLQLPDIDEAAQADLQAHLPKLTNLRQLQAPLELTAATLAALTPLTALTKLHLESADMWEDSSTRRVHHQATLPQSQPLPLRHLNLWQELTDDAMLAAALRRMPCLQELDIAGNDEVTGSSLKLLPRCCPGLKVLRLEEMAQLSGGFLSALQFLTDLATFDLMECNLLTGVPRSVAILLPPNLQTLRLQYVARDINRRHLFKGHSGRDAGLGLVIDNLLRSLPLLRAPLRSLSLQRGKHTPFLDEDISSLMTAAQQLTHLERLALRGVRVVPTSSLQQLLELPALVHLEVGAYDDASDDEHPISERNEYRDQFPAALDDLRASVKSAGRDVVITHNDDRWLAADQAQLHGANYDM